MKKLLIIFIMLLFLPNNILAYELEQSDGTYESSDRLPLTGYDFSHTECNGSKIKDENVVYDKNNQSFSLNGITETSNCKFFFNLNEEEITYSYKVNVTVLNGTISGETTKTVKQNTSTTFTVNPSEGYILPTVTCTNGQTGYVENNELFIENITNNTTCTVKFDYPRPITVTSPNYPNEYGAGDVWTFEKTIEGASSIKVVFSDDSVLGCADSMSTNHDILLIGEDAMLYSSKSSRPPKPPEYPVSYIAALEGGLEYIVSSDTINFLLERSNGNGKFSATLIPLDENGNEW